MEQILNEEIAFAKKFGHGEQFIMGLKQAKSRLTMQCSKQNESKITTKPVINGN